MGRNAKEEAVVKLRGALDATDDPKLIAQLTRQLTKLIPRPKQKMGRPRNAPSPVEVSPESTYVRNGSALDNLPLGEQTMHRLVIALEAEHKRRGFAGEPDMTAEEQAAFSGQIVAGFSAMERAALDALGGSFKA